MNGALNNNFLYGFLLAKDLEQNERLNFGLMAGQMQGTNNLVGLFTTKKAVDTQRDLLQERDTLQKRLQDLESDGSGGGPPETESGQLSAEIVRLEDERDALEQLRNSALDRAAEATKKLTTCENERKRLDAVVKSVREATSGGSALRLEAPPLCKIEGLDEDLIGVINGSLEELLGRIHQLTE